MVAARGDLQRLMSTFFAHPISIALVYANTAPRLGPASKAAPIEQTRQVRLECEGRIVCIATSSVSISNPTVERLFLDEKYAIGQCYRKLNAEPQFALLEVVTGTGRDGKKMLRRRYTLKAGGLDCDIVEVFPDRDMFIRCEGWLYDTDNVLSSADSTDIEELDSDDSDSPVVKPQSRAPAQVASASPSGSSIFKADRARVQVFFVLSVLGLLSVL